MGYSLGSCFFYLGIFVFIGSCFQCKDFCHYMWCDRVRIYNFFVRRSCLVCRLVCHHILLGRVLCIFWLGRCFVWCTCSGCHSWWDLLVGHMFMLGIFFELVGWLFRSCCFFLWRFSDRSWMGSCWFLVFWWWGVFFMRLVYFRVARCCNRRWCWWSRVVCWCFHICWVVSDWMEWCG